MHEAVELETLLARLIVGFADDHEGAGENLDRLGIAAELFRAGLNVAIERLIVGEPRAGREHDFRRLRRELPPRLGRARLHDHRPALYGPRDIERPAHLEIAALVVEHMQLLGIEEYAALDVADRSASSAQESHRPVTTS